MVLPAYLSAEVKCGGQGGGYAPLSAYAILRSVRYLHRVCSAMGLRACYAMSGTDLAYGVTSGVRLSGACEERKRWRGTAPPPICLGTCYAMSVGEKHVLMQPCQVPYPSGLRACYAMSGTDLAYAAICLRACYAVSGTDLAMPGTDLAYAVMPQKAAIKPSSTESGPLQAEVWSYAYGATRCPVLTSRMA
eukprot:2305774-Rhodomonas_salina.3